MFKDNEIFEVEGFQLWKEDDHMYNRLVINGDFYGLGVCCSVDEGIRMANNRCNVLDSILDNYSIPIHLKYAITLLVKQQQKTIEYQQARQEITSIEGVSDYLKNKIVKGDK